MIRTKTSLIAAFFVFFFTLFVLVNIFAASANLNDIYQEALGIAKSNMEKPVEEVANYKPHEKFKKYTDNPSETGYYHGITASSAQDLKVAGDTAYTYSEDDKDNNAVQAVLKSFKKNPKIKIDPNNPNDPVIARAKDIMENAPDITGIGKDLEKTGDVGQKANCKEVKRCNVEYSKETCTEEMRLLQRVCERVPKVTTSIKDIVYPNCKKLIVVQDAHASCPVGYNQLLGTDMVRGPTWDDVRFCTKSVTVDESTECYSGGYQISADAGQRVFGSGSATVPKKLKSRIKISNVYGATVIITVINDTAGEKIKDKSRVSNGEVIELPYSQTQDQKFSFYFTREGGWFRRQTGVMVLYVDHVKRDREAEVIWEEFCRDI